MGLESVEIVMAVEEEFGIRIPDERAAELATVGDMLDFVLIALRQRGEVPDETAIWEHLRAVIVDQIGVPLEDVTRNARFIQDLGVD